MIIVAGGVARRGVPEGPVQRARRDVHNAGLVPTGAAGQPRSVGRERERDYSVLEPDKCALTVCSGACVPEPCGPVLRSGRDRVAVGGPGTGEDRPSMTFERSNFVCALTADTTEVPYGCFPVVPARNEVSAVLGECERTDGLVTVWDPSDPVATHLLSGETTRA